MGVGWGFKYRSNVFFTLESLGDRTFAATNSPSLLLRHKKVVVLKKVIHRRKKCVIGIEQGSHILLYSNRLIG